MINTTSSPGATVAAARRKTRAAGVAVLSNGAMAAVKLAVGLSTGSVSVLSEALHSGTDLLASGIAFFSVRASDTPPDLEHPYGHGKIESVSGLAEAALVLVAAVYIVTEAVHKLIGAPQPVAIDTLPGLLVMAVAAVVNVALTAYLRRVGRETDSPALLADSEHLRTDVLTSVGVFCGLLLMRLTGKSWFDPALALAVAAVIASVAYHIGKEALSPLLDSRLPVAEEARIESILRSDAHVLGYHKLRSRKSGSQRHADVHVQVADETPLVEAHDLTERLEDRIREALPGIHINIHIEPYHAEMRHQREAHGQPGD